MGYPYAIRLSGLLLLVGLVAGCSDSQTAPGEVKVTITPASPTIKTGETLQLSASLSGTSNGEVTWELLPSPPDYGSVSATGLYTAPILIIQDSIFVRIKAVSVAAPSASTIVTIIVKQGPVILPNVNSTFSYASYRTDGSGTKEPGSDLSWTETLSATGASLYGKDNLVIYLTGNDTIYHRQEANGDLAIRKTGQEGARWITYRFGSKGSEILEAADSTYSNGDHYTLSETMSYTGEEQVAVGIRSLKAQKVQVRRVESKTGFQGYTRTIVEDYWYAPAIGKIVRVDRTSDYLDATQQYRNIYRQLMTAYTVK